MKPRRPTRSSRKNDILMKWTELPSGGVLAIDRRLTPGMQLDLEVIVGGQKARWLWILGNGELLKIVTPAQA